MHVLVTGADGFIGSHLVESLLAEGHRVRALSQYNSFSYRGWLEAVPSRENLEIRAGDIRDPHFCNRMAKGMDAIFHLAALIAIPHSYAAPASYVETNVKGTLNLCQAAVENSVGRFLHTSSSEVYGTAQYVPIDEQHPRQPQSPYSASKIGADALAMSFYHAFGLPLTTVRPFNTYGPRQSARAIIPTIISQLAAGVNPVKLGNVSPTRDFNYVGDVADAFLAVARADSLIGQEVNVASNSEYSVESVFNRIKNIMGSDVGFTVDAQRIRPRQSEVFRLCGDASKLRAHTGFVAKHSLSAGLQKTCAWFAAAENLKPYKAELYHV